MKHPHLFLFCRNVWLPKSIQMMLLKLHHYIYDICLHVPFKKYGGVWIKFPAYNFSWNRDIHLLVNSLGDDRISPTWNPRAEFWGNHLITTNFHHHTIHFPNGFWFFCSTYVISSQKIASNISNHFLNQPKKFPVVHLGRRPEAPNHHGTWLQLGTARTLTTWVGEKGAVLGEFWIKGMLVGWKGHRN